MKIKFSFGLFCISIGRSPEKDSKFIVHLFYKSQTLVSGSINLNIVNFNSHTKDFVIKLAERLYKAFIA